MDDLVVRMHMAELARSAPRHSANPVAPPSMKTARRRDDRGEGVISAAIAVLIMAFLGVGVWLGFRATLDDTQDKVDSQVEEIGR